MCVEWVAGWPWNTHPRDPSRSPRAKHETPKNTQLENTRRNAERVSKIYSTTQCCSDRLNPPYCRKAVGWEVYDAESGEKSAALLQRSLIDEQCLHELLVLHSDNGAPMKSVTLLSKMYKLGLTPSRGRPRVSNDNPYSESLFRTLKYCPQWPQDGFASLNAASAWMRDFMRWYNNEHRLSHIRFVRPAERHQGLDHQVLSRRHERYERAKEKKPERWSGRT